MNKIRQNIRVAFIITILVAMTTPFFIAGSLTAAEPDSVSLKIEKPRHILTKAVNDQKNSNAVSFSDNEKVSKPGSSSFSGSDKVKRDRSNQNEENLQDSSTGQTIFSSALSIIYKLLQYFL